MNIYVLLYLLVIVTLSTSNGQDGYRHVLAVGGVGIWYDTCLNLMAGVEAWVIGPFKNFVSIQAYLLSTALPGTSRRRAMGPADLWSYGTGRTLS